MRWHYKKYFVVLTSHPFSISKQRQFLTFHGLLYLNYIRIACTWGKYIVFIMITSFRKPKIVIFEKVHYQRKTCSYSLKLQLHILVRSIMKFVCSQCHFWFYEMLLLTSEKVSLRYCLHRCYCKESLKLETCLLWVWCVLMETLNEDLTTFKTLNIVSTVKYVLVILFAYVIY